MITQDFLQGEYRLGFYVSPRMKSAWAAEFSILSEIDALCRRYGITYYAEVGTLLGTARHRGFVPWDDDIDLAMKREDYMRFLSVAHELPEGFRTRSIYDGTDTYYEFHAVVENFSGDILEWDEERNERFYGCPFICGVDIFPFDYVAKDPIIKDYQKLLYNMAYVMARNYDAKHDTPSYQESLADLEKKCGGSFDKDAPLKPQIYQLADRIAGMISEKDAKELDYYPKMVVGLEHIVREKEWYEESIVLPFEGVDMPIPKGAHEALTRHYRDYGTFVKGCAAHDYPFYKKQEELFVMQGYMEGEEEAPPLPRSKREEQSRPGNAEASFEGPNPIHSESEGHLSAQGRKRIFYYTDVLPILEYGADAIEKIRHQLEDFYAGRNEVELLWHPYERMAEYLKKNQSPHLSEYRRLVADYMEAGWGEFSDAADCVDELRGCDAYYGDISPAEGLAWEMGMEIVVL